MGVPFWGMGGGFMYLFFSPFRFSSYSFSLFLGWVMTLCVYVVWYVSFLSGFFILFFFVFLLFIFLHFSRVSTL